MSIRKTLPAVVCTLALLAAARQAQASSIVVNGGFETGTFSSWTLTVGPTFCAPAVVATGSTLCGYAIEPPHSGTYAAVLGNNSTNSFLNQTLSTTAGEQYQLSFWLSNVNIGFGIVPNNFRVTWNGAEVYAATNLSAFGFTEFVFSGLYATGANSALGIGGFRNDPGYFHLDDVAVTAVPEPATLMLLGSGLAIAVRAARRRRSR